MTFSGVLTAVVTPFNADHKIDWQAFEDLLADQLEQKVNGIVVCGTTGEAATLTESEQHSLIKKTVAFCAGKVPVIAGAGHNNTKIACENQKKMLDLGVDATLQVTPYYNKPSQNGLYAHFKEIAESCNLPFILYNVPSRCGVNMHSNTTLKLAAEFPQIKGIKEAAGSIQKLERLCAGLETLGRNDFSVLSGDDGIILSLLALGGHGVISVISHICAEKLVKMFHHFHAGELKAAQKISYQLIELTDAMFAHPNPVPVKAALSLSRLKGQMQENVRAPLLTLNPEEKAELQKVLNTLGYSA